MARDDSLGLTTSIIFLLPKVIKWVWVCKGGVQAKELISKEDIQELLINLAKGVFMFNAFIRKFKSRMEAYKECHLTLDVKKDHIFNLREQIIVSQHE